MNASAIMVYQIGVPKDELSKRKESLVLRRRLEL